MRIVGVAGGHVVIEEENGLRAQEFDVTVVREVGEAAVVVIVLVGVCDTEVDGDEYDGYQYKLQVIVCSRMGVGSRIGMRIGSWV